MESGETLHEALRREFLEELEIDDRFTINEQPFWSSVLQTEGARFDRKRINLTMFQVQVTPNWPTVKTKSDHLGHGYFDEAEMYNLHLAPANRLALSHIQAIARLSNVSIG